MAKLCGVLRILFIIFNVIFMIIGVATVLLGVMVHLHSGPDSQTTCMGVYMFGGITLLISYFGAHGALKNVRWMLFSFLFLEVGCAFALLRLAVPLAILHPEVAQLEKMMPSIGPLDESPQRLQRLMDELQTQMNCCGLKRGYLDWGNNIPESCDCSAEDIISVNCIAVINPEYMASYGFHLKTARMVRVKTCNEMIINKGLDYVLALLFGFFSLAFLGIVIAGALLVQKTTKEKSAGVTKPSLIFSISSQPPKYTELIEKA